MLIINADDWGRSSEETNATLTCCRLGTVTSVSAMVFMKDSERAAKIARDERLDVGLHINLTEDFTSSEPPLALQQAHQRVARFLRRNKYALLLYSPALRKDFRYVYEAQAIEFRRLYGVNPSHVDGHQHMHHCTNIVIDRIIPTGQRLRRNFSFWPGEKGFANRAYRRLTDVWLARRYRLTDYFFSLESCLKTARLSRVMELAKRFNVELMTHPVSKTEYAFLSSKSGEELLRGLQKGSFAEL